MLYYPNSQRLSTYNKIALPLVALLVAAGAALTYSGVRGLELLDFLYIFSYIKVSSLLPETLVYLLLSLSARTDSRSCFSFSSTSRSQNASPRPTSTTIVNPRKAGRSPTSTST